MQVKMSKGFGTGEPYESQHDWDCYVQGGTGGLVISKSGNYTTCFIEAFPKKPDCFIRGEGKTVQEADDAAWAKYQKIKSCTHEMERRTRTDGYGYCKHCSYSATVFEPLTRCCKCMKPTAYTYDFRKKWYCKKHSRVKPKDPNQKVDFWGEEKKTPRKLKKHWKKCVTAVFRSNGRMGKVIPKLKYGCHFECGGYMLMMDFARQKDSVIKRGLELIASSKRAGLKVE